MELFQLIDEIEKEKSKAKAELDSLYSGAPFINDEIKADAQGRYELCNRLLSL